MSESRARIFSREDDEDRQGPRHPYAGLGVEVIKAAVIAVAVYIATGLAQRPASTEAKLAELDKRAAVTEEAISSIKTDISVIKEAVTGRR